MHTCTAYLSQVVQYLIVVVEYLEYLVVQGCTSLTHAALSGAEAPEVIGRLWHNVCKQLNNYSPLECPCSLHIFHRYMQVWTHVSYHMNEELPAHTETETDIE
jgi:hypothetical protein